MITLDTIVGALGEQRLTAGDLLEWLRASGRLGPTTSSAWLP